MTVDIAPAQLDRAEAQRLTQRIELRLQTIADNVDGVTTMIKEARNGNAHLALGYRSWPEYVQERCGAQLSRLSQSGRPQFVELLSAQGMSTRSIAGTLGVSKNTVTADLSQTGTPDREVTGRDGKKYPSAKVKVIREVVGTSKPADVAKPCQRALPDVYRDVVYELEKAIERVERLQAHDRFPANRVSVLRRDGNRVGNLCGRMRELYVRLEGIS